MKGSYVLVIKVRKKLEKLKVGKLGRINFPRGFYFYVGSGMGEGIDIESRLKRHFQKRKRLRWHVDYLLSNPFAFLESAIILPTKKRMECKISREIGKNSDFVFNGFGSSDCKCRGHLHYFKDRRKSMQVLNKISGLKQFR